ncbi:MAG TPA: hypothetical protein VFL67_14230 [Mycobacterium sp.]|jgi:hypothetical protein|nr:hypothetical protein [Mycobacterium sp.]
MSGAALRALTCAALLGVAALTGCTSTTEGNPRSAAQNPTEPTFPTERPSRTSATPPPTFTPPPTLTPPAGAEALPPQNGYVFIQTKSGMTRCQISKEEVGCEAPFTNSPEVDGSPANGVRLTADGDEQWVLGNLGDIPAVTLDYRAYTAVGWTIEASEAGTKFINNTTGRGMFVAIENVDVF